MRTNYKGLKSLIQKQFDCSIETARYRGIVLIFNSETSEDRIRVVLCDGDYDCHTEIGIHLKIKSREDLVSGLSDAIETSLKDNFPAIYIHQQPRQDEETRKRKIKTIKGWISESEKHGASVTYSLTKLYSDLDSVLESMSQDQVEATLALISMAYGKGYADCRNFRKYLEQCGSENEKGA